MQEEGNFAVKVGVIGTGSMGIHHARIYASMPEECQFEGVYDIDSERAAAVADAYGGEAFRSLPELLGRVDAVSVAVPTPAHGRVGLACADRRVHLLMEKPIAATAVQARRLIERAKANGVVLQVGHIELFNPAVRALREQLAGRRVIALECCRLRPFEPRMARSDVVSDAMIHDISIMQALLGGAVRRLSAIGECVDGRTRHAYALAELADGAAVRLTASYRTDRKVRVVRAVTDDAVFEADLLNRRLRRADLAGPGAGSSRDIAVPDGEPLRLEILSFLRAIRQGEAPAVTGEDGLDALALANRIIRRLDI